MSKTILVTGATDGIGLQTALDLAKLGHHVLVHGRDMKKLAAATSAVSEVGRATPLAGDLSSLASVRELAAAVAHLAPRLDVLLCNAGVFETKHRATADGLEATFAINHVAHFLLAHLLLPSLEAAGTARARSRVVVVSSVAHGNGRPARGKAWSEHFGPKDFEGYGAYALSKLANVLFVVEMTKRAGDRPVTFNALHPGVVSTKLLREGFGGMRGPDSLSEGAATSVFLATSPDVEGASGGYYARAQGGAVRRGARSRARARPLRGERAALRDRAALSRRRPRRGSARAARARAR